MFGYLGGGALPFDLKAPGADFILAFQALPIVLVMSVLTTLLFYWRVLPPIVRGMAWLLERTLGVGGAVGLSTAANIFLGMVEAPLFIRPYLAQLTRSELFLVMTGGMAGIAGTVLVLYATLARAADPGRGGAFCHRLRAGRAGGDPGQPDHGAGNFGQAHRRLAGGSRHADVLAPWTRSSRAPRRGLSCCSTSSRCCWCWWRWSISPTRSSGCCPRSAAPRISLQRLLGYLMAPVCWLIGLPWPQAITAGSLMGTKTVLNELIAYVDLSKLGA